MSITLVYHATSLTTVLVSLRRVIGLSQWFITICLWLLYQYHEEEWYVYHSDLSHCVSDYCISITKKSDSLMDLSQWFITLCLWLYCISITKKSDVYHSDLSRYVSDCTVLVSIGRVIRLSQWFIMPCLCLQCIIITKKSGTSITVIYHAMSQTIVSV